MILSCPRQGAGVDALRPRAVEMIRRGMTLAAALAALGYSINSMAAEER
jgi:hypothetical protein